MVRSTLTIVFALFCVSAFCVAAGAQDRSVTRADSGTTSTGVASPGTLSFVPAAPAEPTSPFARLAATRNAPAPRSIIDQSTRWQFSATSDPQVDTNLIRLGDVVRPVDPSLVAWQRLSGSIVGLMPADGGCAKISSERLAELIAGGPATPAKITIYGPDIIIVRPREAVQPSDGVPAHPLPTASPGLAHAPVRPSVQQTSYRPADLEQTANPTLTPLKQQRIAQWLRIGLQQDFRAVLDAFEVEIDWSGSQVGTLDEIQGYLAMRFSGKPPQWSPDSQVPVITQVVLQGRSVEQSCEGVLQLKLSPHPGVVVAKQPMRRGLIVRAGDLQWQPMARSEATQTAGQVADLEELVGLEVVGLVRGGVPLSRKDFASPRLIRRGDLLEVQVGAGGVRVTTAAKALGEGAAGELIEIETLQPKRRLLAKVVKPSLVEIVTQPTRIGGR